MSRASHTPGPWAYRLNRRETAWWIHAGDKMIADPSWNNYGSSEYPTKDESEANARLISTAPEMLAALRECAEKFRQYEQLHLAKGSQDGREKAAVNADMAAMCEAIVAKATGAA